MCKLHLWKNIYLYKNHHGKWRELIEIKQVDFTAYRTITANCLSLSRVKLSSCVEEIQPSVSFVLSHRVKAESFTLRMVNVNICQGWCFQRYASGHMGLNADWKNHPKTHFPVHNSFHYSSELKALFVSYNLNSFFRLSHLLCLVFQLFVEVLIYIYIFANILAQERLARSDCATTYSHP